MTAWRRARPGEVAGRARAWARPRRLARWLLLAPAASLIWLLAPPPVHAQALYEWRDAGGAVVYSQWPPRAGEGTVVRRLELNQLAGAQRATAARVGTQSLPSTHAAQRAQANADRRVAQALAALQRAERALLAQQAPRSGERKRLVNGHSRLTNVYFERIRALETAVGQARDELQAAYAQRDSLVP